LYLFYRRGFKVSEGVAPEFDIITRDVSSFLGRRMYKRNFLGGGTLRKEPSKTHQKLIIFVTFL